MNEPMVRIDTMITKEQDGRLRHLAKITDRPMARHLRAALDLYFEAMRNQGVLDDEDNEKV